MNDNENENEYVFSHYKESISSIVFSFLSENKLFILLNNHKSGEILNNKYDNPNWFEIHKSKQVTLR